MELGFNFYFFTRMMLNHCDKDRDTSYLSGVRGMLPNKEATENLFIKHSILKDSLKFIKDFTVGVASYCYKFAKHGMTIDGKTLVRMSQNEKQMFKVIQFYDNNSAMIEILNEHNDLEFIWFPILPYCSFRSKTTQEEFLKKVNIANAKTKVEDLRRNSGFILTGLRVDYYLVNKLGRIMGLFPKYIELWRTLLLYLSVVLNCMIMFSFIENN